MRIRTLKCASLGLLLLTGTGAVWPDRCLGPCGPEYVNIVLDSVAPPDGSIIRTDTVTLTFGGTEEYTAKMVRADYDVYATLQRWDGAQWIWVQSLTSWPSTWGPATSTGDCSDIRNVTATFSNVPLMTGPNRFRVYCQIIASDIGDQYAYSNEVTCAHP